MLSVDVIIKFRIENTYMGIIKNTIFIIIYFLTTQLCIASSGIFDRQIIIELGSIQFYNGTMFDTTDFGSLSSNISFRIKGGQLKTYKNGADDITGAAMYYRVYEQGTVNVPDFDTLYLPWKEDIQSPLGSIDQTWESMGLNFDIINGLSDGNYIIEIYFEAFYTDLTGNHTHIDNNNGQNYSSKFTINNCMLELPENMKFCSSFCVLLNATQGHQSYSWSTGETTPSITVSQAGTYTLTISNNSCTAIDSVVISTGTSSSNLDIGNDTTVCGLGLVTLQSGGGFLSYVWSTGDTSSAIQINTSGNYTLTVSTSDDCMLMDSCNIFFNPLPYVDIGSVINMCTGDSVVLNAGSGFTSYLWSDNSTDEYLVVYYSGNYSVTVTDSAGCNGYDVVNVNSIPVPIADFTYMQGQNLTVFFTDNSEHSISNYWDFLGNGNYVFYSPGNVSYTYSYPGTYIVRMVAANDCSNDTTEAVINVSTMIEEPAHLNSVQLYPIPANNYINIAYPFQEKIILLIFTDVNGQTLKTIEAIPNDIIRIDISDLNKGVYFMHTITKKERFLNKIIIM